MKTRLLRSVCGLVLAFGGEPAVAQCQLGKYLELPVTMRGAVPLVSAQIGGKDAQFILDSGAFYSMLSRASAAAYGLRLTGLPPGFRLRGINGSTDAARTTVKSFGLGGLTLPEVDFIVGGTDTGQAGLLGQNFLRLGDVEYDVPHGAVRLLKASHCQIGDLAYWAGTRPVTLVDLAPTMAQTHTIGMITLNGVKLRAIFDTGAASSILTLSAAKRAGLTPDSPGVTSAGFTSGVGRETIRAWIGTFPAINIGGETIPRPKIRFADITLADGDMLIGADFFLTHRIYVANGLHKMLITYEGGPVFGPDARAARSTDGTPIEIAKPGPLPADADGYARQGAVALSNHKPEEALADFDKAIALAPKEGRFYRMRGIARLSNRQPLLAAADLDKAIDLAPSDVDALGTRAAMRLGARDPAGATEDLRRLDALLPPTAAQRLIVGGMADAAGQPELALANFDAWLKSHPEDAARPSALNGRCWARAQLNRDLGAALADCNAALKRRPGVAAYLDSRGLVRMRQGDWAGALADFDAALAANPKLGWSLYARGLVKAKLGDAAGAKADRETALALMPAAPERARRLGLDG